MELIHPSDISDLDMEVVPERFLNAEKLGDFFRVGSETCWEMLDASGLGQEFVAGFVRFRSQPEREMKAVLSFGLRRNFPLDFRGGFLYHLFHDDNSLSVVIADLIQAGQGLGGVDFLDSVGDSVPELGGLPGVHSGQVVREIARDAADPVESDGAKPESLGAGAVAVVKDFYFTDFSVAFPLNLSDFLLDVIEAQVVGVDDLRVHNASFPTLHLPRLVTGLGCIRKSPET